MIRSFLRQLRVRPCKTAPGFLIFLLTLSLAGGARADLRLLQPNPGDPATFVGNGGYSADGLGQNTTGGTVQAEVPAGSAVVQAYLYASYFVMPTSIPPEFRTLNFDGTTVVLQELTHVPPLGANLRAARADVTAQVATKVGTGGGVFDFALHTDPLGMDGVALVVIYENPSLPLTTIAILDGGASQEGDTAVFNFAAPLDTTIPGFSAVLTLGIGFSFQGLSGHECRGGQFSTVEVNGQRLTSCAGSYDDGEANNGALITVGGVGDSTDNPVDPLSTNTGTDDELYNLAPFLSQGDTQLSIETANPSRDDIVFLAVIAITAQATVTTEICDDGIDNDRDGLVDRADPECLICGDGILDPAEECDDGNTADGDGCSSTCEEENQAPVALCQNPVRPTAPGVCTAAASVDNGSFDPDGDAISLAQAPPGPYNLGTTAVTLTVTDAPGLTDTCSAIVTVIDQQAPSLSCGAPATVPGGGGPIVFTSTATDNCQASLAVQISSATCFNGDIDDDGVPNEQDECRSSDVRPVLHVDVCVTGVANTLLPGGCTFSDRILRCATQSRNHGQFVSCVSHLTNQWKSAGLINGRQKGAIERCAAQAPIPASRGNKAAALSALVTKPDSEILPDERCPIEVSGGTIRFPDPPGVGFFRWTISATDGSGNSSAQTCEVLVQRP